MDIHALTESVKQIAVETGKYILQQRQTFQMDKVESKHSHDYVSYVDKESEKMIVSQLRKLLPEAGFITEEGTTKAEGSTTTLPNPNGYQWIVDPLDGTTNFIHNMTPYCVSIALKDNSGLAVGVVYECVQDELFWANRESKAYLNGTEINVSKVDDMYDAFVCLGLPYDAQSFSPFVQKMYSKLYGNVCSLRNLGSAETELCYVACGRFDVYIEALIKPWDVSAGALILMQAGGKVSDFDGNDNKWQSGDELVATNGLVHKQMIEIIKK